MVAQGGPTLTLLWNLSPWGVPEWRWSGDGVLLAYDERGCCDWVPQEPLLSADLDAELAGRAPEGFVHRPLVFSELESAVRRAVPKCPRRWTNLSFSLHATKMRRRAVEVFSGARADSGHWSKALRLEGWEVLEFEFEVLSQTTNMP